MGNSNSKHCFQHGRTKRGYNEAIIRWALPGSSHKCAKRIGSKKYVGEWTDSPSPVQVKTGSSAGTLQLGISFFSCPWSAPSCKFRLFQVTFWCRLTQKSLPLEHLRVMGQVWRYGCSLRPPCGQPKLPVWLCPECTFILSPPPVLQGTWEVYFAAPSLNATDNSQLPNCWIFQSGI